jgi:hypothetical protein
MALNNCPDCGNPVSTKAESCLRCGRVINESKPKVIVKSNAGCCGCLVLIVLVVVILHFYGFWIFLFGVALFGPDKKTEIKESIPATSQQQTTPQESTPQESPVQKIKENPILSSFDGIALPAKVIVTEKFSLMNNAGKETEVSSGTVITIMSRSPSGTLTMKIDGELFVGKESRLAGKTKVQ